MINRTQEEIMQNWGERTEVLVSINCITYNHAEYISQCLDGFLKQKTDFPFEILVHDDASTDNTADIIREYERKYPGLIKPVYQSKNQYSAGGGDAIAQIQYSRYKGKYIAYCEGDDYWIDENKLQLQTDFLESHSDYGLSYTRARLFIQKKQKFSGELIGSHERTFEQLLKFGNNIPTLTVCLRRDLLGKYLLKIQPQNRDWLMGDYPLWLWFAHESKIKYFNKITSVYRFLEESASHSKDIEKTFKFRKSTHEIRKYFADLFSCKIEDYNENKIYFSIYHDRCSKDPTAENLRELRRCIKLLNKKSVKLSILNCCSRSKVSFLLYIFFRRLYTDVRMNLLLINKK